MTSIDETGPHYRAALRAYARERERGLPSLPDGLYVKRSRLRRKAASKLMAQAGMVRPARRFKTAPMRSGFRVVGECDRVVGQKRRRLRRRPEDIVCGGAVVHEQFKGVFCVACRGRRQERRELERQKRMQPWRASRGQAIERSRSARLWQRFRRSGAR